MSQDPRVADLLNASLYPQLEEDERLLELVPKSNIANSALRSWQPLIKSFPDRTAVQLCGRYQRLSKNSKVKTHAN